jgi:hypothetical protein
MTDQFCRVAYDLLDGEAVTNLSSGATRLLLLIWRRHTGFNNGRIECTKRDAIRWCHCGSDNALAYFKELTDAGLITRTRKGAYHHFGQHEFGTKSTWRLNFL